MAFSLNNMRPNLPAGELETQRKLPTSPVNGSSSLPPRQPLQTGHEAATSTSIIGRDLELRGTDIQIIVRGKLMVDGKISGEVYGEEVTIGRDAQISGKIVAQRVAIHGTVSGGEIFSDQVALMNGSQVAADIHHRQLSVEEGAMFEGRSRRAPEGTTWPKPASAPTA